MANTKKAKVEGADVGIHAIAKRTDRPGRPPKGCKWVTADDGKMVAVELSAGDLKKRKSKSRSRKPSARKTRKAVVAEAPNLLHKRTYTGLGFAELEQVQAIVTERMASLKKGHIAQLKKQQAQIASELKQLGA